MTDEDRGLGWITSPSGRVVGAWWNVAICGVIVIGSVVAAIVQSPMFLGLTAVAALMEVRFVRMLLATRREIAERGARERDHA